jgi:type II secretory pathway component PulF
MDIADIQKKFAHFQARISFNAQVRARTYGKLSGYLRNGVSTRDAVEILLRRANNNGKTPLNPLAIVLKEWFTGVLNGDLLAVAAKNWLSENDRIVLEAGEKAGRMEIALENALYIAGAGKKIKGAVIFGLAYPLGLFCVAIGLALLFGLMVIPTFEEIIPRERWEGGAVALLYITAFAETYVIPTVVALGVATICILFALPRWVGPLRAIADRYPPFSIYRLVNGAGFMLSVSALIRAGMPLPDILTTLMKGSSPWYYEKLAGTLRHVSNGKNLGDALAATGHQFPDKDTVEDLQDYATMDRFDETLEKLGREWVESSVGRIQSQMSILKQVGLLLVGGTFATIALGLMALQGQLGSALN